MNLDIQDAKPTGSPYEVRINCPHCDDQNYHMYVNTIKGVYHCFKCQASGRLSKIKESEHDLVRFWKRVETFFNPIKEPESLPLELPKEFKLLVKNRKTHWAMESLDYLARRGLSLSEIKKYQIGYCSTGWYEKRVIIPAIYLGRLEYFVGRSLVANKEPKYLNPKVDKKGVLFYSEGRPTKFAVICEGVFDAISIARVAPAIALLGKELSDPQLKRIISSCEGCIVMLDPDADKYSFSVYARIRNYIKCTLCTPGLIKSDPGGLNRDQIRTVLNTILKRKGVGDENLLELYRRCERD